jgi:hypothetical protein
MRRHILTTAGAVLLAGVLLAGCGGDDEPAENADQAAGGQTETDPDADANAQPAAQNIEITPELAETVLAMRAATGQYVTGLSAARAAGFQPITEVDSAGVHLLKPSAPEEFDANTPAMLVYSGAGEQAQLAALGWVFTEPPAELPLGAATYGKLAAACSYEDGMSVPAAEESACEAAHPESGSPFTFWHPDLTTLHVWAWSANPDGLFAPTNPLMSAQPDDQQQEQQEQEQQQGEEQEQGEN